MQPFNSSIALIIFAIILFLRSKLIMVASVIKFRKKLKLNAGLIMKNS